MDGCFIFYLFIFHVCFCLIFSVIPFECDLFLKSVMNFVVNYTAFKLFKSVIDDRSCVLSCMLIVIILNSFHQPARGQQMKMSFSLNLSYLHDLFMLVKMHCPFIK